MNGGSRRLPTVASSISTIHERRIKNLSMNGGSHILSTIVYDISSNQNIIKEMYQPFNHKAIPVLSNAIHKEE